MRQQKQAFVPPFCPNDKCEFYYFPPDDRTEAFAHVGSKDRDWYRCRLCRKKFRATIFLMGYHGYLH